MNTILIIIAILAIGAGIYLYNLYNGNIKDDDGDFIPDSVEEKVEDIKEDIKEVKSEVKRRVKRVKEELSDVKDAGKNLAKQTKDVADAVKGKPRRGRRPSAKKSTHKKSAPKK